MRKASGGFVLYADVYTPTLPHSYTPYACES